jgi:hypothetical protein
LSIGNQIFTKKIKRKVAYVLQVTFFRFFSVMVMVVMVAIVIMVGRVVGYSGMTV